MTSTWSGVAQRQRHQQPGKPAAPARRNRSGCAAACAGESQQHPSAFRRRFRSNSESARADSPSCPSPYRRHRCRPSSRCIRTADRRGCRSRSGRVTCTHSEQSTQDPRLSAPVSALFCTPARLTAFFVVGDDHRHGRNITPGSGHRDTCTAHLLAHEAGVAPGCKAVEQNPEGLPRAGRRGQHLVRQGFDRREVPESESGPQADQHPNQMLVRHAFERHRRLVELHGAARSPQIFLDPHEDFGINRLRAGVTTKDATGDGGDEEQRVRRRRSG